MDQARFLFTVCQVGAEAALKAEVARHWPAFRFSFSRPGFVTFKLPDDFRASDEFDLRSVFARTHGFALGRIQGGDARERAQQFWQMASTRRYQHLHVWQRDSAMPGENGFEPGSNPSAEEVGRLLIMSRPQERDTVGPLPLNRIARPGELVVDCIIVESDLWWVGYHRACSMVSRWPGGVCRVTAPANALSRAYLKMVEALRWSRLPMISGDRCVEIGTAPGGAAQALLERGLHVVGIDPANVDPVLLQHPNFTHIKKRGNDVRRREFRGVRWLTSDCNVAPQYTLDTVEAIVMHREVQIRGLLLMLKLLDWKLAEQIPAYVARIHGWGFEQVRSRQLAFNRQEICVAALRSRSMRRQRLGGKRNCSRRNDAHRSIL